MQGLVVVEAVKDFLFGFVADGTGVVEDQPCFLFRLDLPVALLVKCANHLFGVMGIHLATEGLKVEGLFSRHNKFKYIEAAVGYLTGGAAVRAEPLDGYSEFMPNEQLTPLAHSAQNRCFGCGPANPGGLRLQFFSNEDQKIICLPRVGDSFEGPPGFLHGGIIATLLDEAMSKAVRVRGVTAMTRQMEIEYLRPVHSGTATRIEGWLVRSEGRKYWTEAKILDEKHHVLATARGLFIEVRANRTA